jgi:ATP-binding cassette subfamily F protein 3
LPILIAGSLEQASRVDVAKLAKAEAKIKVSLKPQSHIPLFQLLKPGSIAACLSLQAKIEKRSRRDLYEGSKLVEMAKKQQSYEEMFMKVNPLQLGGASKGKSKDIHLSNIDVSFASNRILCVFSSLEKTVVRN